MRERLEAARMACLIELIYAPGLRVSEALSLKKAAATAKAPIIAIAGKGDKERLAPLSGPARAATTVFRALLDQAPPARRRVNGCFPAASASGHMTRQAFARDLKRVAAAAEIDPQRVSPHVAPRRQPSLAERGRPARRPGPARPRRHFDDTDLYPRARRARQGDGARPPSDERRGRGWMTAPAGPCRRTTARDDHCADNEKELRWRKARAREPTARRHAHESTHLCRVALAAKCLSASVASPRPRVYCSEGSPENFTPAINTTGTSFDAARPVYNRLTEFNRGTTIVGPGLAESWDISDGGKTIVFHLRKGVKFHTVKDFNTDARFQRG